AGGGGSSRRSHPAVELHSRDDGRDHIARGICAGCRRAYLWNPAVADAVAGNGVEMMSDVALEVRDLSVVYPRDKGKVAALDHLSLEVPKGQFVVAIGPSGQGKSTLLKVVAGLVKPSSGSVFAHGEEVRGPSGDRGMVFQKDTVFPWMRVKKNIGYGLRTRGLSKREQEQGVNRYCEAVGLAHVADAWPKELSGGMRKRVAVAAAFANDPSLLLMDEPFGSLDFVTRATLHTMLLELWQATKKTIVFVTHDVDEALKLSDRIVVLSHGKIVDDLNIDFARPRTDALRSDPAAIALRERLLARLGLGSNEQPATASHEPAEAGR
ncbi:MAG: ABC transporter ATP-binding protein, partial [Solirubrobacterales bacterium]